MLDPTGVIKTGPGLFGLFGFEVNPIWTISVSTELSASIKNCGFRETTVSSPVREQLTCSEASATSEPIDSRFSSALPKLNLIGLSLSTTKLTRLVASERSLVFRTAKCGCRKEKAAKQRGIYL